MLPPLVHTRWRIIGSHPLQSVRTVQGERMDRNHHLARPGLGNRYLRDLQHLGPSIPSPCHRLHPRLASRNVTQMPCDAQPSKASCYAATPAHLGMGIARPTAPASRPCSEASPGTCLGLSRPPLPAQRSLLRAPAHPHAFPAPERPNGRSCERGRRRAQTPRGRARPPDGAGRDGAAGGGGARHWLERPG